MAKKVGEAFSGKKVETEDSWVSDVQSLLVEANGLYWEVLILVICLEVVGAVDLGSLLSELIEDRLVGEEKALELVRNYKLVSLNGGDVGGDRGGDSDNGAASALLTEDRAVNLQAKLWKGDEARGRAGGIKCLEIGAYGDGSGHFEAVEVTAVVHERSALFFCSWGDVVENNG